MPLQESVILAGLIGISVTILVFYIGSCFRELNKK